MNKKKFKYYLSNLSDDSFKDLSLKYIERFSTGVLLNDWKIELITTEVKKRKIILDSIFKPHGNLITILQHESLAIEYDTNNEFLCEVEGDSMIESGIQDGDVLIVSKTSEYNNFAIIVFKYCNCLYVKRYVNILGIEYLNSENKLYDNYFLSDLDIELLGVVDRVVPKPEQIT